MSTVDRAVAACFDVESARDELQRAIARRDELLAELAKEMPQRRIPTELAGRGVTDGVSLANVRLALARQRS